MICKIENPEEFDKWKLRDIYSVKILSLLKSYGCKYHFASFYKQVNEHGNITAIISRLDNDLTLALGDDFDNSELVHFFCVTGFNSILTSNEFEFGAKYEEGMVMSCSSKRENKPISASIDEYPKLMDLFNFVDYEGMDFKAWYVDISHRVRHNTAKAYTLTVDDNIISSGILSSIYEGNAILTAVRTADDFRKMGYGSYLVNNICSDVKGTVYIMRDMNLNESFYTKLGFKNIGKWRIYKWVLFLR